MHSICRGTTRHGTENMTRWLTSCELWTKFRFFCVDCACPVGLQWSAIASLMAANNSMLFRFISVCFCLLSTATFVCMLQFYMDFFFSSCVCLQRTQALEVISIKIDVTSSWQANCSVIRCWSVIYGLPKMKIPIFFFLRPFVSFVCISSSVWRSFQFVSQSISFHHKCNRIQRKR